MSRCEGWTRTGGAFSFGPVIWTQCEKEATVRLRVVQEGKESTLPACNDCWKRAIEEKISILQVLPLD